MMKNPLAALLIFSFGSLATAAEPEPEKSASEIIKGVRYRTADLSFSREGTMRKGFDRNSFKLSRSAGENSITVQFESTEEAIVLKVQEKGVQLTKRNRDGVEKKMLPKELFEPIEKTDVIYDDLARSFLYWPDPKVIASEKLIRKMRDCWVIRLDNPEGKASPIAAVRVWVDKKSNTLLKTERFDWKGKLVRRSEVSSVQYDSSHGEWITKGVTFESIDHLRKRKTQSTVSLEKPVAE